MLSVLNLIKNLVDLSFWRYNMADSSKVSSTSNLFDTIEANTCRGYVLITGALADISPAVRPPWTV